jgi:hypothetical protein
LLDVIGAVPVKPGPARRFRSVILGYAAEMADTQHTPARGEPPTSPDEEHEQTETESESPDDAAEADDSLAPGSMPPDDDR